MNSTMEVEADTAPQAVAQAPDLTEIMGTNGTQDAHINAVEAHEIQATSGEEPVLTDKKVDTYEGEEYTHDEYAHEDDEYNPADPIHGEDEYDPAHPDAGHADDEYDPAHPGEGMDIDTPEDNANTTTQAEANDPPASPSIKREPGSSDAGVSAPTTPVGRSPKRQRREGGQDKRGLRDAVWDRLMDFESLGEFRIAQVSRAAFASVASLPEFAQCTIIARFTRTPMKDVKDKNSLMLRLHQEYMAENPHISSLSPVTSYGLDTAADVGLFEYGYAPPVPTTGVCVHTIPCRKDKPGTITTPGAVLEKKTIGIVAAGVVPKTPAVDEFGRAIGLKKDADVLTTPPNRPTDPRRAATTPAEQATASTQPVATATTPVKPSDPRRRGTPSEAPPSTTTAAKHPIQQSDVYARLPLSVRGRLDALVRAGRLPESINDNVLSRLNHLSEASALSAITKFGEADLRQVGNVNGFLVGIINRVQERPAPAAAAPPPKHQHQHAPPSAQPHHHAAYTSAPASYAPPLMMHDTTGNNSSSYRDPRLAPPGYDPRQPPALHTTAVSAPHPGGYGMESGGAPPPAAAGWPQAPRGRFSTSATIDKAISLLPVSVQNHLVSLVNMGSLPSVDELSEKCYEVLAQQSEGLANEVLKRFGTANLTTVRNRSGFLIGVVKKCRQEFGFD